MKLLAVLLLLAALAGIPGVSAVMAAYHASASGQHQNGGLAGRV